MRMYDLIMKKRDGGVNTPQEIKYIVEGFTRGEIPDYQMSAWLMSVFYQGMTKNEIVDLTLAMAKSGDMLDLSSIHGIKVDKHSTGGVGDKTTFIVAPVLAALGVPMAKMSGRGLGHTGGTIDKLESIPGFSVAISEQEFIGNVNKNKLSIVGQTGNLAPADKKIYALRDVTATVDSIPLIASSIMSKKLAAGADVIVLDIKCGSGAFMKTIEEAKELAKTMVDIGNMAGKKTYGIITDMNEPLGCKVGNALEVKEAIEVLKINNIEDALTGKSDINHGIRKLIKVSLCLAAYMLIGAEKADDYETAYNKCVNAIESGQALKKFAEFVKSQGGDDSVIYNTKLLPEAKYCVPVYFSGEGYISYCKTSEIGMVSLILGGGRAVKEDKIDLAVGIDIRKHLGEYVSSKEPFAYIHANNMEVVDEAVKRLVGAYNITDTQEEFCDIIKDIILPNNK
mgnify:CR=1 FL=1